MNYKKNMVCIASAALAALAPAPLPAESAGRSVEEILYDDFEGGETTYAEKWTLPFYGIAGEFLASDGGALMRDLSGGSARFHIPAFTAGSDFLFFDHIKYLATSTEAFEIPENGSITFVTDIDARTLGVVPGLEMEAMRLDGAAVRYPLEEAQQACVTMHMLNFHETGQLFDWLVTTDKAYALSERLFAANSGFPPAGIGEAYTQIVAEIDIEPGPHEFAMRYSRVPGEGVDRIEWLIDGAVVASHRDAGVPLDVQVPGRYERDPITYPALGPGEPVKDAMQTMIIGHGLFSLLDVFPFGQAPVDYEGDDPSVTIPVGDPSVDAPAGGVVRTRLFGQGARAEFDDVRVIIERR